MPHKAEIKHFGEYLGDGAYVYMDDFQGVVLYTSNGIRETNRVVLEPEVLRVLKKWLEALDWKTKELIAKIEREEKEKTNV